VARLTGMPSHQAQALTEPLCALSRERIEAMPEEDNLDRKVRKLAVEHAETRWLALRLDDDVKELRSDLRAVQSTQQEHTARFDSIDGQLQEHTAKFDSIGGQLRSLTQLVGQVLERLPEQPRED
jgi:chromosome segregation ATPase